MPRRERSSEGVRGRGGGGIVPALGMPPFLCVDRRQRGRLYSEVRRQAGQRAHKSDRYFWSLQRRLRENGGRLELQAPVPTALMRARLERAALNNSAAQVDVVLQEKLH